MFEGGTAPEPLPPPTRRSKAACGLTMLYSGVVASLHEMLRECGSGRPSNDDLSVERPNCAECRGVGGLPPLAVASWFAIAWSMETALFELPVPLALVPV